MWRIYSIDNVLFLLHRITGIGLFVYLILHIWTVSTAMLGGPQMFNDVMTALASPKFLLLDMALLGGLIFHIANGLRLMAHERGLYLESASALSRVTVAAWLGLWGAAGFATFVI